MMHRRKLLRLGAIGAIAGLSKPLWANGSVAAHKTSGVSENQVFAKIISTWSHGMEANQQAWKTLSESKNGLDAIERGLMATESDVKNRSVGIGGMPDREGHVTLDACIMDYESRCGSVAYVEGIAHPISVARHVMENTPHVMLVGHGAEKYAIKHGFERIKTPLPEVKAEYKKWLKEQEKIVKAPQVNHENHDTIGMLLMDHQGRLFGGCTTSGWAYKLPGRLGDSPIIGAGLFIDQEAGGAVATGLGECIIRIAGSHTVVELMRQGASPDEACHETVNRIIRKHKNIEGLQCGFLAINKNGEVGGYSVYNGFNFAYTDQQTHVLKDAAFDRKW